MRGWLTMAAVCGAASGTLITSMRHCVGLPEVTGAGLLALAFSQPASSAAGRTPDVPEL